MLTQNSHSMTHPFFLQARMCVNFLSPRSANTTVCISQSACLLHWQWHLSINARKKNSGHKTSWIADKISCATVAARVRTFFAFCNQWLINWKKKTQGRWEFKLGYPSALKAYIIEDMNNINCQNLIFSKKTLSMLKIACLAKLYLLVCYTLDFGRK